MASVAGRSLPGPTGFRSTAAAGDACDMVQGSGAATAPATAAVLSTPRRVKLPPRFSGDCLVVVS